MFSSHDHPLRLTVGLSHELMREDDPFKEFISALLSPEIKLVAEAVRHFVEVSSPAFLGPLLRIATIQGDPLPSKVRLRYGPGLESVVTTTVGGESDGDNNNCFEDERVGVVYVGLNDRHGRHLRPMDDIVHLVAMDDKVLIQGYRSGWPSQSNHIVQRIERIDSRSSRNMFTPQQATSFRTPLNAVEKGEHIERSIDNTAKTKKPSMTMKTEETLNNRTNTVNVRKSPRLNHRPKGTNETAKNQKSSPKDDHSTVSNATILDYAPADTENISKAARVPMSFDLSRPTEVPSRHKDGGKTRSKRTQASRLVQEAASSGLLPKNGKRLSTPAKKRGAEIMNKNVPKSNNSRAESTPLKRAKHGRDEGDFVEGGDDTTSTVSYLDKVSAPAAIFEDVLVSSSALWASEKSPASPSPSGVLSGSCTPPPDTLPSSPLNAYDDNLLGTKDGDKDSKVVALKTTDNVTKTETVIAGIQVPPGNRSPSPTFLWLQESCRARGLPHIGGREELVGRLARFDDAAAAKQSPDDDKLIVNAAISPDNETKQKVVSDRTRPSKKELQEMCVANGLSTTGSKADLRARLLTSMEADEDSEDDTDYTLSAAITMGMSDSKTILNTPRREDFDGGGNEHETKEGPLPRRRSMNQKTVNSKTSSAQKFKSSSAGGLLGGLLGGVL
uniref:SAP domain-containing protein n=1 Tax=Leptocylindrus danicus TaxID=163516 RepID=A0A7S2NZ79_9STRA|mmetsp:Transcript_17899/g.26656  ORF Transcript_17899/g.26656 Transcript_17899/m.26656 type:complete len:671 (+) Transcript_17899:84-2096(+)|eukprot:CAMPEP_0116012448 /NCGR_PEP_ID=MMETSP0321-20121206/5134_1 /TAXON_ID=163516 /ORGANISM="Leptocylindrus danicus var. danicus, Strain B650" /LENGTH=670 /DNA_ID=CAMNT_0003481803 /DNA_START=68 /DNA_END=2080 /DNA_ORIENTATION=+